MPKMLPHMRKLKARMVLEGYDQKALAAELGRSQTYVTRRMNGIENFTSRDIEIIVKFLNIKTVNEFLDIFFSQINFLEQCEV